VVDVLGPAFAPRNPADAYIDNSVLDGVRVDEKADILREGEEEIERARAWSGGDQASPREPREPSVCPDP
jgi:hypothetical protein